MIDVQKAKSIFSSYVNRFDLTDGRIKLKIQHSYKVSIIAKEIAIDIGLSEEEICLAEIIGLFHDIGRFEQVKRYQTFLDSKSVDHADLGVHILQEEDLLSFINEEDRNLILKAIAYHNKYQLPSSLEPRTLMHAHIIRDADKTDIFRVNLMEKEEHVYLCTKEQLEQEEITAEVYDDFMNNQLILSAKRKTHLDILLSHIAFIYDYHYAYGLSLINKENYIPRMIEPYTFKNKQVQQYMQEAVLHACTYIEKKKKKK